MLSRVFVLSACQHEILSVKQCVFKLCWLKQAKPSNRAMSSLQRRSVVRLMLARTGNRRNTAYYDMKISDILFHTADVCSVGHHQHTQETIGKMISKCISRKRKIIQRRNAVSNCISGKRKIIQQHNDVNMWKNECKIRH